jgi:hypothetical protein
MSFSDQEIEFIKSHGLGIAKYHTEMPSNGRSYTSSELPSDKSAIFSVYQGGSYSSRTHADEASWGVKFYALDKELEELFLKMNNFEVKEYFKYLYKNMNLKFGTIDHFQKERDSELSDDLTKQFGNENVEVKCKFSFDGNHEYKIHGRALRESIASSSYYIVLPVVSCRDIEELKIEISNYKEKMDDTLRIYHKYDKKLKELFKNDVTRKPIIRIGKNTVNISSREIFASVKEAYENFLKEEEFKYNQAEENIKKISEKLNFPQISFIYKDNFYSMGYRTIYFDEIEIIDGAFCYKKEFYENFFNFSGYRDTEKGIVQHYLLNEQDPNKRKTVQDKYNKFYYPKYREFKDLTSQWIKEQLLTYRLPYAEGMVKLSKESHVSEEFLWEVFKKTK